MKNQIEIKKVINPFNKQIEVSGDKSISIRCVLLASQAIGKSKIYNFQKKFQISKISRHNFCYYPGAPGETQGGL